MPSVFQVLFFYTKINSKFELNRNIVGSVGNLTLKRAGVSVL